MKANVYLGLLKRGASLAFYPVTAGILEAKMEGPDGYVRAQITDDLLETSVVDPVEILVVEMMKRYDCLWREGLFRSGNLFANFRSGN